MDYAHLHVHSYYSLFDGYSSVKQLLERAKETGASAIAITDSHTLSAAPELLKEAAKYPGIKPIIGCELYIGTQGNAPRYQVVFLAKDLTGYRNLMSLVSLAHIGSDDSAVLCHEMVEWFHEGLICLSGNIFGEIPRAILSGDLQRAEKAARWYKSVFGDDFYLEATTTEAEWKDCDDEFSKAQFRYSTRIIQIGAKTGIKVVATNNVRFARKEDYDGYRQITTLDRFRNIHPFTDAYMKTRDEMLAMFPGHPEVVDNTLEVAGKIRNFDIRRQVELPEFPLTEAQRAEVPGWMHRYSDIIGEGSHGQDGILRGNRFFSSMSLLCHLAFEGAGRRYGKVLPCGVEERLVQELKAISAANLPDLFLIYHDIIDWARHNGICVGPGRGSSAGSLVMFCLGITDVDPLRFGLLFERFLDPESGATPFVYVDFDEKGRVRVIEHLAEKYGDGHLALIIVFGALTSDDPRYNDRLKGVVCKKGIHSCSVILGGKEAIEYVPADAYTDPVSGRRYLVSQYPDDFISQTGALQLGIIGIGVLSVVKECLARIKERHGVDIRFEDIPLGDPQTFELYRRGDTDGVFHFEAPCMKRMVSKMQPDRLEDLMMMDALYRPASAHLFFQLTDLKKEESAGDSSIPVVDDILAETFGLVVYQEQVMEIAQRVAGFTPGHSDKLRKALCRNDGLALDSFRSEFIQGGLRKGFDEDGLEKIWESWLPLGRVIFNKSHAACYALLSYRTAWLKAHYPKEFAKARKKHEKR